MWKLALAYPKIAGLLVVAVLATGWHFQDKISDWWDGKKIARLESQVAELKGQVGALVEAKRLQDAANEAASAARERNDTEIPEVRRESAARVERAGTADAAQRVQDVGAAVEADRAAASLLRGAQPR